MAIKFRNSLFGFNKEDVYAFVSSSKENEYKYENKLRDLKDENEKLNASINVLNATITSLSTDLAAANEKVKDFEAREEALTRLSESIGRLYLVAQTNAKAIAEASKANVQASENAVTANINAANIAENDFNEIEAKLNEQVNAFNKQIASLKETLAETREKLQENRETIENSQNELEKITV